MKDKAYMVLFIFLGVLNIAAFFVYKNHLKREMSAQYEQLYRELNEKLAAGNDRLKVVLSSISNDCIKVVEDFKANIQDFSVSPNFSISQEKREDLSRKEIDYYWFIDGGVPKITIGREHYSLGDILPTGEKIIRITDYCLTTDNGLIYNSSRSSFGRNTFKESEVKL